LAGPHGRIALADWQARVQNPPNIDELLKAMTMGTTFSKIALTSAKD
jgi:hypothetical protein